jgi:hypothetical protein
VKIHRSVCVRVGPWVRNDFEVEILITIITATINQHISSRGRLFQLILFDLINRMVLYCIWHTHIPKYRRIAHPHRESFVLRFTITPHARLSMSSLQICEYHVDTVRTVVGCVFFCFPMM